MEAGQLTFWTTDDLHEEELDSCQRCRLCATRTQVVLGAGPKPAPVFFFGEAPGKTEDDKGVPFVGDCGDIMDKALAFMGLVRERVFISNVIHCRPPGNRDPGVDEITACQKWLLQEIEEVSPTWVVAVGRVALSRLSKSTGIRKLHGCEVPFDGPLSKEVKSSFRVAAMCHPSFLLRDPSSLDMYREGLKRLKDLLEQS